MGGKASTTEVARYYSEAAEQYQAWVPVIRPMSLQLFDQMPLAGAERVLDLGTGVGSLVADLAARAPAATIVGADLSEGMLRVARRAHSVPFAAMDAQRLALAGEAFDAAVLPFMLFHVPNPARALEEVARALRPGGIAGTATWGDDPPYPAMEAFVEELEAHGAGEVEDLSPDLESMNTPEKISALLEAAGLSPQRAWTARSEFRWEGEAFFRYLGYGFRKKRLDTLSPEARGSCLARLRERLDSLGPEAYAYPFEAVYALARRP
jgi:ubiquinone/menaquinone biosynthesis C-methylase UbiE